MARSTKRKTSLTLDIKTLEAARALEGKRWLAENAGGFAAQSDWHERYGHPLADIITSPGGTSWTP